MTRLALGTKWSALSAPFERAEVGAASAPNKSRSNNVPSAIAPRLVVLRARKARRVRVFWMSWSKIMGQQRLESQVLARTTERGHPGRSTLDAKEALDHEPIAQFQAAAARIGRAPVEGRSARSISLTAYPGLLFLL